jgi:tetratricopeptide (TPR) repeat protein
MNKIILFILCLALSACGSKATSEDHYFRRAKALMVEKNYDRAVENFNNVLGINPNNHEAYYYLGLIYETRQDYVSARLNFTRALEIRADYAPAQIRLGSIDILQGQGKQAQKTARAALQKNPTSLEAKLLLAETKAKQGDLTAAINDVEAERKSAPDSLAIFTLLGKLYRERGDFPQAENVLLDGARRHPKNTALRSELANLLIQSGQKDRAETPLRELIALEPANYEHQLRLASYYTALDSADQAEKILRDGMAAANQDVRRKLVLTEFLSRHRSVEQAEAELQGFIQAQPDVYDLRFALAELYESVGMANKAERVLGDIGALQSNPAEKEKVQARLAGLYAGIGKFSAARPLVDQVLNANQNNVDALVVRGKLALADNDTKRAIADFRWALKEQPNSVEFAGLLAKAHLENKEPALAREVISKAVQLNPDNRQSRIMLVDYLLQTRDYDTALTEINILLAAAPLDAGLLQSRAAVLAAKKNLPEAQAGLLALRSGLTPTALANFRLGTYYASIKKYDTAAGEFLLALKYSPDAIEPLKGLTQAYLASGRADLALNEVKRRLRIESPVLHQLYFLLGETYLAQQKFAEAERAYARSLDINPYWHDPYLALAQFHHDLADDKKAQAVLELGLKRMPDDPIMAISFAGARQHNGEYERAIADYEAILKTHPSLDVAANNIAALLTEKRGDKASLERALNLARRFENSANPAYVDTLGWAYVKNGQTRRGLALLNRAMEIAPAVALYQYHAGMAYKILGDREKAKIHLNKALASQTNFEGMSDARATLAKL